MFNKYEINLDTNKARKNIYDRFITHLDGNYIFTNNSDYIWFKENVIEQKDQYTIVVDYSESKIEFEWGAMIRVCIIFINDFFVKIETKEIELVGYYDQELPKFEKRLERDR